MPTTLSAETQKWLDQNHTSRSTKPVLGATAESMRALASFRKSCCGSGGGAGCGGFGGGGEVWISFATAGAEQGAPSAFLQSRLLANVTFSASFLARAASLAF